MIRGSRVISSCREQTVASVRAIVTIRMSRDGSKFFIATVITRSCCPASSMINFYHG